MPVVLDETEHVRFNTQMKHRDMNFILETHNRQFYVQLALRCSDLYYDVSYHGPNLLSKYYNYSLIVIIGDKMIQLPAKKVAYSKKTGIDFISSIPVNLKRYADVELQIVVTEHEPQWVLNLSDSCRDILYETE